MTKKTKKKRKPSKKKKSVKKRNFRKVLYLLFAALLVSIAFYVAYTYFVIQSKFDGVRWALPARVYSRPLEVYSGYDIKQKQLNYELSLLNYDRLNSGTLKPGQYKSYKNTFDVYTRSFTFDDGNAEGCYCRIVMNAAGAGIDSVVDLRTQKAVSLLRFEPYHYASIYPLLKEDRDVVSLEQVPPLLVELLLAVEDQDFYFHHGVKPTAIVRALFANIRAGRAVQGGSTITQQLVKNFFLTNERTLVRKMNEAVMAILLEFNYSKQEILEAYLNEVFLGQQGARAIHGFALASRYYFSRSLDQLNVNELAMLVGMVKGPSYYNPFKNQNRALARRNTVLKLASEQNIISTKEYAKLKQKKLSVAQSKAQQRAFPAYIEFMKQQLAKDFSNDALQSEGLRVFSALDPYVQNVLETSVQQHLGRLEKQSKSNASPLQVAAIVLDTSSAEVVAMVGDKNPRYSGFNRALYAKRPIGSLLKPFIYLEALSHTGVFTPSTILQDKSVTLQSDNQEWSPANYDRKFHGEVPMFSALANSYNASAVDLGMKLGLKNVIRRVNTVGSKRSIPEYPSILLGAIDMSPMEVAGLYYPLSAKGYQSTFRAVQSVLLASGERIQAYPVKIKQVVDQDLSYQINYLLQYVASDGTARRLNSLSHLSLAAKTGTSNDLRDSWLVAYSGKHLIVVWVGNDENKPTGLTGSSGALPIAESVFEQITTKPLLQKKPRNIDLYWVDQANGKLSQEKCKNTVIMPFITGTQPEEVAECSRHSLFKRLFGSD